MSKLKSSLSLTLDLSSKRRNIFSFEDLIQKENLKKIICETKVSSLLFSINYCFNDLRFKIDPLIRICGEKIWAKRILEDDYDLPFYIKTLQDSNYMKFFGAWKFESEESLKERYQKEFNDMNLNIRNKKINNLILMFLDHEMNFLRFYITLKKFSDILNKLNNDDKNKFFQQFNQKIQNFNEEKDVFFEISYISSINNAKKGFGDRVLKLFLKNIDQIIEFFRENNESLNNDGKNIFFATYHPENLPSGNLLLRNSFEKVTEESFYIKNYNAPRNFVCMEI